MIIEKYYLSTYLELKFGLSTNYFKKAFRKGYKINAQLHMEFDKLLFVKLPDEVVQKLRGDYICMKIDNNSEDECEYVYHLSKNCKIGFWK